MANAVLEPISVERIPVSVVIPTLNEAARIESAIDSVRWADEVIVIDAGSADGTALIARRLGARVMTLTGETIGAQRNAGIAEAKNDWVLALDADEEATPELRASLASLCAGQSPRHRAFRIRSRNWHLGKELRFGPWGRDWKVRVFSRSERFSSARVHENLEALDDVGELDGTLIHHPYRDLSHQIVKIAKYAKWAAEDMRARGRRGSVWAMLTRPFWRFIRDYVVLSGWRDGRAGFIVATVSAFSVFLKYAVLLMPESN
ncbi:MAG TPA: glycosyltransferase family 2 protein [Gemmatimonadaceae bacterium]|jgi:glycosyltransferase involved in cell wall biosynthesis